MSQEDLELIKEEFKHHNCLDVMQQAVITKGLIEKLLNTYNTCSYVENCYDSEPNIPYEEWEKLQETEEGKAEYAAMVEEHEPRRKSFCNWQDLYEEGVWFLSEEDVRGYAKALLTSLKKESYKNPRFYIGKNKGGVSLYYYGRDKDQVDYWFDFYNE